MSSADPLKDLLDAPVSPRLRRALHRALDVFLDELAPEESPTAPVVAVEPPRVPSDLEARAARNAQIELRRYKVRGSLR